MYVCVCVHASFSRRLVFLRVCVLLCVLMCRCMCLYVCICMCLCACVLHVNLCVCVCVSVGLCLRVWFICTSVRMRGKLGRGTSNKGM